MATILTIDDEPEFTDLIKDYFEPRGFKVLIALNGDSGLKIAGEEKPDIAFIDIKMPGKRGDQVLVEMKQVSPDTKSIIITASEGQVLRKEDFIKKGAYECFEKPLASLKDLENKVRELLDDK